MSKFRVYCKSMGKMGDVAIINYMSGTVTAEIEGRGYLLQEPDYIRMQSTGLKDKNGNEIFDKDIIKNKDGRLAIVKWHGTYASFVYIWLDELDKNKQDWQPLYLAYMKFEVVGNVYQNPELIEEANNVDD